MRKMLKLSVGYKKRGRDSYCVMQPLVSSLLAARGIG